MTIMDNTTAIPKWSHAEFLAWLDAARQRKEAWQKKVDAKYAERMRRKQEAAASGYYDLEWV